MSPAPTTSRHPEDEILESLVPIVSIADGEIVFVTCVDDKGRPGESEVYSSRDRPKGALPLELVLQFPVEMRVGTILVTSRAAGSLDPIAAEDLDFTRELIAAAAGEGIEVLDHVLVKDGEHLKLRDHTDLWD